MFLEDTCIVQGHQVNQVTLNQFGVKRLMSQFTCYVGIM